MKKIYIMICFSFILFICGCSILNSNSNCPIFSGYFIESERIIDPTINVKEKIKMLKRESKTNVDAGGSSIITSEMNANKGEYLFITLQFINNERDTFVDLVLNDSDYGNDKVYDSFSKTNKIHSVETYKLDGKWVSDITLVLPVTKANDVRKIEVTEVNFLKQTINKQITADLTSESYSTYLNIKIIDEYVPSSKYLFEYKEVTIDDMNGYEITKINYEDYGYPNIIYFPSYIDEIPVISIGKDISPTQDSLSCKVCVIPETIRYFYDRILNSCTVAISEKLIILSHHLIELEAIDPYFNAGFPTYYLWDDFIYESRGEGFDGNKIGYNAFPNDITFISLNTNEEFNSTDLNLKQIQFEWSAEYKGYVVKSIPFMREQIQSFVIPSEYNGAPVIGIGDDVFNGCHQLTNLVIPDTIIFIGERAFFECPELKSVVIPSSVAEIGFGAFETEVLYCAALSKPAGWNKNWKSEWSVVYWAGEWEYDSNGNPVPLK